MRALPGRTDTSVHLMTKVLRKHNLKFVVFYLTYNLKLMGSFGHWKGQRGMVDSKNL